MCYDGNFHPSLLSCLFYASACLSPQEHLHLALARALVAHPQRAALLAASAPLHPTCLADVPLDVLSQLREQHQHDVEILKQVQDEMTAAGSSQPPLQVDELLRIMLVLRFNAHYRYCLLKSGRPARLGCPVSCSQTRPRARLPCQTTPCNCLSLRSQTQASRAKMYSRVSPH